MTYDPEQIRRKGLEDALDRVREIVSDTLAYMRHMETAPPLLADGLSGDYRLLAEYNGTVLAGHQTQYGVQSITWDRLQDGTLWQAHYFNAGEGMDAAKQDFATRSGLVDRSALFTPEQLTEVYRCIHETLESVIGYPFPKKGSASFLFALFGDCKY